MAVEWVRPAMDRVHEFCLRFSPVVAPAGRLWLRLEDCLPESAPILLIRAFSISLAAHLLLFASTELAFRLGLLDKRLFPALLLAERARPKPDADLRDKNNLNQEMVEIPVVFVSVEPSKAAKAPPKTQNYSTHNSEAATAVTKVEAEKPKITGKPDDIPATRTVAKVEPPPTPAAEAVPKPKEEAQPLRPTVRANPEEGLNPGTMTMAKPAENATTIKPEPALSRPRTLAEAAAQAKLTQAPVAQEGGQKKFSVNEAMDAAATPFGEYDERIILAIEANWNELLDARKLARTYLGKVVVTFRQHSDGHVSQVGTAVNEGDAIMSILCERAIEGAAANNAFGPWPSDMRRMLGLEHRLVKFTFHYN